MRKRYLKTGKLEDKRYKRLEEKDFGSDPYKATETEFEFIE